MEVEGVNILVLRDHFWLCTRNHICTACCKISTLTPALSLSLWSLILADCEDVGHRPQPIVLRVLRSEIGVGNYME